MLTNMNYIHNGRRMIVEIDKIIKDESDKTIIYNDPDSSLEELSMEATKLYENRMKLDMFMDWLRIALAKSLSGNENGYREFKESYPQYDSIEDGCEIDDAVIDSYLPDPNEVYSGVKIYQHVIGVLLRNNRYAPEIIDSLGCMYIDEKPVTSCYTKLFRHIFANVAPLDILREFIPDDIPLMFTEEVEDIYHSMNVRAKLLKMMITEIDGFDRILDDYLPLLKTVNPEPWEDYLFDGDVNTRFLKGLKYLLE